MVRIAGLEPARLAALPPQSSVSANSTICAHWGLRFCPRPARKQVFLPAQQPIPALPAVGLHRAVELGTADAAKVHLNQEADAARAPAGGADGINAVGIGDDALVLVRGRPVHDARADAADPVAGLAGAGQIINACRGAVELQIPALVGRDGHQIARVNQRKFPRAEFLEIIARQRQGIFGDQRQKSAQTVGAHAVGIHAGAGHDPHEQILFALRPGVRQRGGAPE